MIKSGFNSRSSPMNFSSRAFNGCNTGRVNFSARFCTGDRVSLSSRPLGLSDCVTTATTEKFLSLKSFSRLAQESSAVPIKMIRSGIMARSLFGRDAQDVGEHLGGRQVGVDLMHEPAAIKLQHGLGFLLVGLETFADDAEVRVVEAVFLERAALDAVDQVFLVGALEIKNASDINRVAESFRLARVARDAVKHERVLVRMKTADLLGGINELPPQLDGLVVRHQLAAAGIINENLPERAVPAQVAEDFAARAVEKIRDDAEDFSLRALAHARRAK